MSTEYSGLPTVARRYWRAYTYALVGTTTLLLFTGAAAAVIVLTILPAAKWFFVVAAASFIFHFAALFVMDIWRGEYDPSQTTISSASGFLGLVVVLGVTLTTILLIGTVAAYAVQMGLSGPSIAAVAIAAYYPVIDLLMVRRDVYTPSAISFLAALFAVNAVITIHQSMFEALPVIRHRRPHS